MSLSENTQDFNTYWRFTNADTSSTYVPDVILSTNGDYIDNNDGAINYGISENEMYFDP